MALLSLAEQAYDHILDQLLARDLRAGDWLDRRAVAGALQISLAPVSEAVLQLEAEGFLETIPRRGTRVRVQQAEEIRGQLLVREALECQAARLYCGPLLAAQRDTLECMAREADAETPYTLEAKRADLDLHQALVRLAGCPVLTAHFERVMKMSLFLAIDELMARVPHPYRDNHVALIHDLCDPDPDRADARIRQHIRRGKEFLFERDWPRAARVPGIPAVP